MSHAAEVLAPVFFADPGGAVVGKNVHDAGAEFFFGDVVY